MKICSICKIEKSLEEFSINTTKKDGRNYSCKSCARKYAKQHYLDNLDYYKEKGEKHRKTIYKRNNNYIIDYLEKHPCVDCGESDIQILEFDHKEMRPSAYVAQFLLSSLKRLREEIELCEIRCANCHTRRTRIQLNKSRARR